MRGGLLGCGILLRIVGSGRAASVEICQIVGFQIFGYYFVSGRVPEISDGFCNTAVARAAERSGLAGLLNSEEGVVI
jgi:hypothetical protein